MSHISAVSGILDSKIHPIGLPTSICMAKASSPRDAQARSIACTGNTVGFASGSGHSNQLACLAASNTTRVASGEDEPVQ
jgi:hypothetical protein